MSHDEVLNLTRLVTDLHLRLDNQDAKAEKQEETIQKLSLDLAPIIENLNAGKILYNFTLKALALITAIGGAWLLLTKIK